MKNLIYFFSGGFAFLLFPLLHWQHNIADLATQVSGTYQVHYLQVFGKQIDTSKDFVGLITITKTDTSHVMLGINIHRQKDDPTPVETLCILKVTQSKMQLVEVKTGEVLGYVMNRVVHLNSSDSKGAKTKIIAKQ
jgi:hypothetical protein